MQKFRSDFLNYIYCCVRNNKKKKNCRLLNNIIKCYLNFRPPPYSNNSVFDQKMLPNSNRTLLLEQSGWERKKAEWSRNSLRA